MYTSLEFIDDLYSYDVEVEITHYFKQEPDFNTWASDVDYKGWSEVDYEVVSVVRTDEDGKTEEVDLPGWIEDVLYDMVLLEADRIAREDDYGF